MTSITSIFILYLLRFTYLIGVSATDNNHDDNVVKTYSIPDGIAIMDSYTIRARAANSATSNLVSSYQVLAAEANITSGAGIYHNMSVAYFDFSGTVHLSITYNNGPIQNATVRPLSYGIKPSVSGNVVSFSLHRPRNIVVEVNGNIWDVLNLMTNPLETDMPDPSDPDVLYFGPGINNGSATAMQYIQDGLLNVPSNKILYLAGGGVLTTIVQFNNVTNSQLRGRGVVKSSGGNMQVGNSTDIIVRDVIQFNSGLVIGSSKRVLVSGLRSFTWAGNGDGMDLFCDQDVVVENVFHRNSDDNVAIYQHRDNWYGDSKNITIRDSSLWADYAHPINIGTHGNTQNPETMDGIKIENIDILDHREYQLWYQGCIAINAGDSNMIQNIHVENIRVENFRHGQLVNLRVMDNTMYNTSPGRGIKNVYIKDMVYNGNHSLTSLVLGYDQEHNITNVVFEGLEINGLTIWDGMQKPAWYKESDYIPMFVNEHVFNISFLQR
ncbi:pectin lyase fold/virulence factor [Penicillium riverlandense]|uniref:pectin lyase fold/virulence factor n=1 Tax=Penicillium riverlandense TaxID=1903569 RepID=UPI002546584C|nr:pectin lyase fold/virulence factor [Penicillium riverlandense]KAJ5833378.1 pectin lyase fold/virulence factor [Penicillium riverlandense]